MSKYNNPFLPGQVRVDSGFWEQKIELVRREVLPYQWKAFHNQIDDAEPSWCIWNFHVAAQILQGELERRVKTPDLFQVLPEDPEHLEETFYGFVFQDSDFYKWLEAVAYLLAQHPDVELERLADEAIDLVCAAQREDGYLDTYFIIRNPDSIFSNLRDFHELYCFGHLAEAAVAYEQATGKGKLLTAAKRYAAYIAQRIGPEKGQIHGYPGHELAEMALIRLYEQTGEQKYLKLAGYFLEERGKRPYYFHQEHPEDIEEPEPYRFYQAHRPIRQQKEAVGHAVRAMYLYSAMADFARLKEDQELFSVCEQLWRDVTERKMYITGGVGGTVYGEAFSHAYDLPADSAYAETCASVGLIFWARRMLQVQPHSTYADVMERALYNGVLSGIALDGKSFFYVNPLECRPVDCRNDRRKEHVKPIRQKWFSCACCPPNLSRLIGSIGQYAFTQENNRVYIHLMIGAVLNVKLGDKTVRLDISSDLPWDGRVRICVRGLGANDRMQLAMRVPDWTDIFCFDGITYESIDDWMYRGGESENGYLLLDINKDTDISFAFSMPVRFIRANQKVREAAGQLTVMRGPIVYCLEEADNGPDLHLLRINPGQKADVRFDRICDEHIIRIITAGVREAPEQIDSLYHQFRSEEQLAVQLNWIPYYTWANRGENEMQVWCRRI